MELYLHIYATALVSFIFGLNHDEKLHPEYRENHDDRLMAENSDRDAVTQGWVSLYSAPGIDSGMS